MHNYINKYNIYIYILYIYLTDNVKSPGLDELGRAKNELS